MANEDRRHNQELRPVVGAGARDAMGGVAFLFSVCAASGLLWPNSAVSDILRSVHLYATEYNSTWGGVGQSGVQFLDDQGRVVKTIARSDDAYASIQISRSLGGRYVGASRYVQGTTTPYMIFEYYNERGKLLWTANIYGQVSYISGACVSPDGSAVALLDAGEGDLCFLERFDHSYVAPKGRWGLRVLSASGRVLFRDRKTSTRPTFSKSGRFLLYLHEDANGKKDGHWLLDLAKGQSSRLPGVSEGDPSFVDDEGVVLYSCNPNGGPAHIYKPGKGLIEVRREKSSTLLR